MLIDSFILKALRVLPSALVMYFLAYFLLKWLGGLSLTKQKVAIGFFLAWLFSTLPIFIFGGSLYEEIPGGALTIPLAVSAATVFALFAMGGSNARHK